MLKSPLSHYTSSPVTRYCFKNKAALDNVRIIVRRKILVVSSGSVFPHAYFICDLNLRIIREAAKLTYWTHARYRALEIGWRFMNNVISYIFLWHWTWICSTFVFKGVPFIACPFSFSNCHYFFSEIDFTPSLNGSNTVSISTADEELIRTIQD